MKDIIKFENYTWRRDGNMKFEKLINELKMKNNESHEYSLQEIIKIANDILSGIDYYTGRCATCKNSKRI